MMDLRFLTDQNLDTVAALVMELAAQLHEERSQRIALEVVLEEAGLLQPGATARLSPIATERAGRALDGAIAGLARVMAEDGPPQHPIRREARDDAWTARHA